MTEGSVAHRADGAGGGGGGDAEDAARQVDRQANSSEALEWAVRIGLVAYGVVHLLVGWVAVQLVVGSTSGSPSGSGALQTLADDPVGQVSLVVMAVGFAALAVWQAIIAAVGYRKEDGWKRHLKRAGAACRMVVYGYFAVTAVMLVVQGPSSSGGSSQSQESTTARLLAAPAGPLIVTLVGLAIAGLGIGLAVFGLRKKFLDHLDREARTSDRRLPIVVVGQVGYVTKGLAYAAIGGLVVWAALTHDPQKTGGLDQSLHELLGYGLGGPAVVVVGVGIACFGLYCFARSWHLDDDDLTS